MLSPDSEPKWHCHHARNRLFARTSFNGSRPILSFLSDPFRIPFRTKFQFRILDVAYFHFLFSPFPFYSSFFNLFLNSQSELLLYFLFKLTLGPMIMMVMRLLRYFELIIFSYILIVFSLGKFTLPFSTLFNPILYLIYGERTLL